jgi:hypothetical protein
MALSQTRSAGSVPCAFVARLGACCLALAATLSHADDLDDAFEAPQVAEEPALAAPLAPDMTPPARPLVVEQDPAQLVAPEAEELRSMAPADESYDSLVAPPSRRVVERGPVDDGTIAGGYVGDGGIGDEGAPSDLRPFDWMRHWGFHHSSTEGPYLDRGLPMEHTSWLNRPYHIDWFLGPLLSDGPVDGRVSQSNDLFGGLRAGWDFDYYWGVEWRFGWSSPTLFAETSDDATNDVELQGTYFASDVDFVYYPWGDTKIRPYMQWGLGLTQVGSVHPDGTGQEATLLSMPMGIGVIFPQTHWLAWRLEIIDNLAFGADGVDTLNNFAFTAGMELRMGARPGSYWPWRSSRTIW